MRYNNRLGDNMGDELMEIIIYILALIGLACVVKHLHFKSCTEEGCCLCNWLKPKMEEAKTKMEEGQSTGSRYGSNPVKY
jgi:hypothetical protein